MSVTFWVILMTLYELKNTLLNLRYVYLSRRDRSGVVNKLPVGPSPFKGPIAIILGGGRVSEEGGELLKDVGVDLAINASNFSGARIRNIVFEIPRTDQLTEEKMQVPPDHIKYLNGLLAKKAAGTRLYYRPSARDFSHKLYKSFLDAADYYSFERRFAVDNLEIAKFVSLPGLKPTPYYRFSIFLAIWWAVASGCKEIHLYGITLAHASPDPLGPGTHKSLRLVKGENSLTLLYKLWLELRTIGVDLKIDNGNSLSGVLPTIQGEENRTLNA